MEEGEQVGKDRHWENWRAEEGKVGYRNLGEAEEPRSQKMEEGEVVQGEGRGLGESWVGERSWVVQEVGGLDSAHWYASGLVLRTLHHYTCVCQGEEVRHVVQYFFFLQLQLMYIKESQAQKVNSRFIIYFGSVEPCNLQCSCIVHVRSVRVGRGGNVLAACVC